MRQWCLALAFAGAGMVLAAGPRPSTWCVQRGLVYGRHEGVALAGDLYTPGTPGEHPAVIAVHGGGWWAGDAGFYAHWGPYLARRGYVVFAIDYRLSREGRKDYPQAVQDVRAAVQFIRSRGAALKVDPDRIGLMGDSAGAHLAALVSLAGDEAPFAGAYPDDPYAAVSARVKVCVAAYGIYDLAAQWRRDASGGAGDNITQAFLGADPVRDSRLFAEASPLARLADAPRGTAFLVTWGTKDEDVDPATQSVAFARALERAGLPVETLAVPGAPHGWATGPILARTAPGFFAPRLMAFLRRRL